jgi:hypothetical protein
MGTNVVRPGGEYKEGSPIGLPSPALQDDLSAVRLESPVHDGSSFSRRRWTLLSNQVRRRTVFPALFGRCEKNWLSIELSPSNSVGPVG